MVFREKNLFSKKIFEKKPRKRLILARDIGLLALLMIFPMQLILIIFYTFRVIQIYFGAFEKNHTVI